MNRHILFLAPLSSLLLCSCATFSFAPPSVRADKPVADNGTCPPKAQKDQADIGKDVEAALQLVENYRIAYGCASGTLANGRQLFEVPAALALAGGTAAAAFGAGPGAAIGTGAAAATLGHGNGYYAPKQKAHIVAAAHDAVVCIKQEASGITAMTIQASEVRKAFHFAAMAAPPSVSFSPEFQYFQQVSSALQNIGAILAERLSSVGSYSPDAIAKEIVALAKEAEKAKSDPAKKDATETAKSLTSDGSTDAAIVNGIVELAELQPRLKLCVLRAKAG